MALNLCTSSDDVLYLVYICTKFHENILDGLKVIERTLFTYEKFRRAYSFFSAHRLMVI